MIVRRFEWMENKEIYTVHLDDEDFNQESTIEFPFRASKFHFKIVGYCNGVFCLADDLFGCREDKVVVWNPSTQRRLTLRAPGYRSSFWHDGSFSMGFGYDCFSDDYKVVRLAYIHLYDPRPFNRRTSTRRPQVEIYALKEGLWRRIEFPHDLPSYSFPYNWSQVFFNGASHWIVSDDVPSVSISSIMTFNMSTEVFGEILLPEPLVGQIPWTMATAVIEDSLAVIHSGNGGYLRSNLSTYSIWITRDHERMNVWTVIYRLHHPCGYWGRALQLRSNGDIIMASRDGHLIIRSTDMCNYVFVGVRGFNFQDAIFVDRYEESLALLDVGYDILTEERRIVSAPVRVLEDQQEKQVEYVIEEEWFERYVDECIEPLLDE